MFKNQTCFWEASEFWAFFQSVILISNQPFISSRIVCSGIAWIYPLEVSWQDYLHAWPSAPWGCWVQATASIWKAAIWWVWDQGCKLPSWGRHDVMMCIFQSLFEGFMVFSLPMKQLYGIMTGMLKAISSCKSESPNLRFGSNFRRRLEAIGLAFYQNNNQLDSFLTFLIPDLLEDSFQYTLHYTIQVLYR